MIRVADLDLVTQATAWAEVERMARSVVAAELNLDIVHVQVDLEVVPDPEAQRLLAEAQEKEELAARIRAEALAARQNAARRMHGAGWSYRLIGKAMHLTHQRAEQLVKGRR
ncbi:MAG: hypothetical protein ACR2G2_05440 [Pseudonocardia sp.]